MLTKRAKRILLERLSSFLNTPPMQTVPTHLKYIKRRNPEELHEDTLRCISELQFIDDELDFLNELIKEHTLDLISETFFEESKSIATKLSGLKKEFKTILSKVEHHRNNLDQLMDDVEIANELDIYKENHYNLMFEVVAFHSAYKTLKKHIFVLIKNILKAKKNKKLPK